MVTWCHNSTILTPREWCHGNYQQEVYMTTFLCYCPLVEILFEVLKIHMISTEISKEWSFTCSYYKKRAAWVILDVRYFQTPSSEMSKSLNWMPLRDRVTYRKACMMYKSLNGLAPVYMSEMFKYVYVSHSRDTRTSARCNLSLPSGKHKDIYINSFAYSGAKI